jgi:hypothetical protein
MMMTGSGRALAGVNPWLVQAGARMQMMAATIVSADFFMEFSLRFL